MAFTPRTSKYSPSNLTWSGSITTSNKWWYNASLNGGANYELCLPNCTTYAKGRSSEISGQVEGFLSGYATQHFPQANAWYSRSLWETGQTPRVGAIACFQTANSSIGGHLAIVESTDGTLANTYVSFSGYVHGTGTRTYTNPGESTEYYFIYESYNSMIQRYSSLGSGYALTLQGFMYNPSVEPTPTGTYRLSLYVNPEGGGYWTGSSAGDYDEGETISITAVANEGYTFEKIVGTYEYTDPHIERTMTKNRTYTAYFKSNVIDTVIYNSIVNRRKQNGKHTYIYI